MYHADGPVSPGNAAESDQIQHGRSIIIIYSFIVGNNNKKTELESSRSS